MKKENIIILILLSIVSLFTLWNSDVFIKQLLWYLIGFGLLLLPRLNVNFFFQISKYLYYLSIILLVLVLFVGKEVNGSKAWFDFNIFSFQPSELMKVSLILYLPSVIKKNLKSNFKQFIKLLIIVFVPSVLVFIEPDTGAIFIYLIILFGCLLTSKINKKYLFITMIILLLGLSNILILYFNYRDIFVNIFGSSLFYRIERIIHYKESLQLQNSLILVSTTQLLGYRDIPLTIIASKTDFIFSNIIVKSGIIGLLLFLVLYLKYLNNIIKVKINAFNISFLLIIIFQFFYNILMNIGILPIMGITLPFISYGGSSIIVYFFLYKIFSDLNYR